MTSDLSFLSSSCTVAAFNLGTAREDQTHKSQAMIVTSLGSAHWLGNKSSSFFKTGEISWGFLKASARNKFDSSPKNICKL